LINSGRPEKRDVPEFRLEIFGLSVSPRAMNKVTAAHSVLLKVSPEDAWNYTQDWNQRSTWDPSVVHADYISVEHPIAVKVRGRGGFDFSVTYKVSQRPKLTTLVMTDLRSFWVKGGGGSWKYEEREGQTLWTQHNTLVIRDGLLGRLFRPLFALILGLTTRQIMKRAKVLLERSSR
jgi:hypothetical protein